MNDDSLQHLFKQAKEGEFALLSDQARQMSSEQFAVLHQVSIRHGVMDCVTVEGCEYYWSRETGKYDGWGRSA